jgi:hypothetical protein
MRGMPRILLPAHQERRKHASAGFAADAVVYPSAARIAHLPSARALMQTYAMYCRLVGAI